MISQQCTVSIYETAALWHVRQRGQPWTREDEQALDAWLQQDSLHRTAFLRVARTWEDFSQVPRPHLSSDTRTASMPRQAARPGVHARPSRLGRLLAACLSGRIRAPAVGLALTLALALVVGGGSRWRQLPPDSARWTTSAQAPHAVTLPDGSHVSLNINTSLHMQFHPDLREITLLRGEAFFEVAADPQRPFVVSIGMTKVHVTGTSFNVRAAPPRVVIKVREGQVRVTSGGAQPETVLTASRGVAIDPDTGQQEMLSARPETVGDWRSGALTLQDMTLADLGTELSRYIGSPISVEDATAAGMRVSGLVNLASPRAFIESLSDLIPVTVSPLPGGGYCITQR